MWALVGTPHCDSHRCPPHHMSLDVILRAVGRIGLGWPPRGLLPQERPAPGSQAHATVLGDRPELELARSCSYRDQESPSHSTPQCSMAEAGGCRNEVEPRPQALPHMSLTGPLEEDRDTVCWGGWPTQCPKAPASVSLRAPGQARVALEQTVVWHRGPSHALDPWGAHVGPEPCSPG